MPYWWNRPCFVTLLGIFFTRGEKYYFHFRVEGSSQGVFATNIGKLRTRKNSNFIFGWRGALVGVGYTREVGYTRWITWGRLCEVGYARWITRGTSHLVKCFTPWYFFHVIPKNVFMDKISSPALIYILWAKDTLRMKWRDLRPKIRFFPILVLHFALN